MKTLRNVDPTEKSKDLATLGKVVPHGETVELTNDDAKSTLLQGGWELVTDTKALEAKGKES